MVQASLNRTLDVHPFAAFLADESFDGAEAGEGVQRAPVWTPGATDLVGRKFHQPRANGGQEEPYRLPRRKSCT